MGAFQSLPDDKIKINKNFINDIAINYIQNGTYTDMINLTDAKKCQETIILTKDIIKKKMTKIEIEALHSELYKDALTEVFVSPLLKLQSDNEVKCKQIAEHYVLIGNIFNMIKKAFLLNSDNRANGDKDANLCVNRLNRIRIQNDNNSNVINISKNVCSDKNTPEIDNLETLYGFKYKHDKVKEEEQKNYSNLLSAIKKSKESIGKYDTIFNDLPYQIEKSHSLAKEYETIIKNIENNIMATQIKLINILHKIFYYDEERNIRIHPKINGINIETLAKETRMIVTDMYLTCENEFHKSVDFQEKINNYKRLNSD